MLTLSWNQASPIETSAGSTALEPVALVRTLEVVEPQVLVQVALHRGDGRVVGAAEDAAPELREDRALQPLGKAIGPGVPGLGVSMLDAEDETGLVEGRETRCPRRSGWLGSVGRSGGRGAAGQRVAC